MTSLVVIPARWGSTRLPGKPLALIGGQPLLARTVDLVRRATRTVPDVQILVATDDERVGMLASTLGCAPIYTDAAITSGSARVLAAIRLHGGSCEHILNVQGDAPFIPPEAIGLVLAAIRAGTGVATPVVRLDWRQLDMLRAQKRTSPFSGTTCIVDTDSNARWFSKQIIPAIRDEDVLRTSSPLSPVHRHIGLYGYTRHMLERFDATSPSTYETLEGLEQLRLLEMGVAIRAVRVPPSTIDMSGIDTLEDIYRAESLLARHGDPFGS